METLIENPDVCRKAFEKWRDGQACSEPCYPAWQAAWNLRHTAESLQWRPISTAPKDGSAVLLYRPLAHKTQDPVIRIAKSVPRDKHCWDATVPEGCKKENYTDGACYASHWMPLPSAPLASAAEAVAKPVPKGPTV